MIRLERLMFAVLVLLQGTALAQEAAPVAPPAEPAPAPAPAEIAAPAPEPVAAPVAAEPAPIEATSAPVDAPVEEAAPVEEEETPWSDNLSLGMFVDTYYNFDFNRPDLQTANSLGHNPYVRTNGFALAFLGLDAAYSLGDVGAVASLRFGPGASPLIGQTDTGIGLDNIWQAYLTYAPTEGLTLDMVQFATIYGAEVGESWMNINYTRGALYFNYQPFWHTGLRVGYQASDMVKLNVLVVNGVNQPLDGDRSPEFGLQLALTPADIFFLAVGWYGSPIDSDGKFWSNFVDVVATLNVDAFTLIGNFDIGFNDLAEDPMTGVDPDNATYWGLSLAAKYAVSEQVALGLRGEYLADPDALNFKFGENLITGTATVEYAPVENIIFRLDGRVEKADADIYSGKSAGPVEDPDTMEEVWMPNTDTLVTAVLGVVVKTN
jgi:hypothetical protein